VVIDELAEPARKKVSEENLLPRWGTSLQLRGPTLPRGPWGRVEAEREGNHVTVTTRGVARFRLLLSPDEFDLTRPVTVAVDGRTAFDGLVEPSLATLLAWAAIDDDRTCFFAAELSLEPGG
jgi:hypothetical protein